MLSIFSFDVWDKFWVLFRSVSELSLLSEFYHKFIDNNLALIVQSIVSLTKAKNYLSLLVHTTSRLSMLLLSLQTMRRDFALQKFIIFISAKPVFILDTTPLKF